jgi:hypothetical protein
MRERKFVQKKIQGTSYTNEQQQWKSQHVVSMAIPTVPSDVYDYLLNHGIN